MGTFVRHRFSFVPGFFGNRLVGSLINSKMEDVINQSSNYDLTLTLLLGPADRFVAVLCVCRGLFGKRLTASLKQLLHKPFKSL